MWQDLSNFVYENMNVRDLKVEHDWSLLWQWLKKAKNRTIIPGPVSVKILDPDPECYQGH